MCGKMRGLKWAFVAAAGIFAAVFAGGEIALAQTSEVHMQGHQCRNLGKSNKVFDRNYYIYFDTNSSVVDPKYKSDVKRIVRLAEGQKAGQICLFGKASKIGDQQGNIRLSHRRAQNVADEFVAAGWPRSKIAIVAEGEAWGWLEETLTWDAKEDRRVRIRLSR